MRRMVQLVQIEWTTNPKYARRFRICDQLVWNREGELTIEANYGRNVEAVGFTVGEDHVHAQERYELQLEFERIYLDMDDGLEQVQESDSCNANHNEFEQELQMVESLQHQEQLAIGMCEDLVGQDLTKESEADTDDIWKPIVVPESMLDRYQWLNAGIKN